MPNKHNDARRHHFPRSKYKIGRWTEYDASLRRWGSLTLWMTEGSTRGGETLAQAHPQAIPRTTGDDDRQARFLRRGPGGNGDEFRASTAQGAKQSGGDFASADEAARENHEAVQIRHTSPALRLHPRSDRQPSQVSPPRNFVIRPSSASFRGDDCMARDRRTGRRRITSTGSSPSSHARRSPG